MIKIKCIYKIKNYPHLDTKKNFIYYKDKIQNPEFIKKHGFFPFIHKENRINKVMTDESGKCRQGSPKIRDIKYSSHIDRYIYQYYSYLLNKKYNRIVIREKCNECIIAYRNNLKGKCNIDFAKEIFEFIAKGEEFFIYVADFEKFFDNLDHKYLKERIKEIIDKPTLPEDYYKVFKSITKYSYIQLKDILSYRNIKEEDLRNEDRLLTSKELKEFKAKKLLNPNENNYGIPQGSSISAVLANIYMLKFDIEIQQFVSKLNGLYRRYCDDIIIIIPLENNNKEDFLKYFEEIKGRVTNLKIQDKKTQKLVYSKSKESKLVDEKNKKSTLTYLGFDFNGDKVSIRQKSISKYYNKTYRRIKVINNLKSYKLKIKCIKELYKRSSHLGAKKYSEENRKKYNIKYGNFLTYVKRAQKVFNQSNILKNDFDRVMRRHWKRINNKLIKIREQETTITDTRKCN